MARYSSLCSWHGSDETSSCRFSCYVPWSPCSASDSQTWVAVMALKFDFDADMAQVLGSFRREGGGVGSGRDCWLHKAPRMRWGGRRSAWRWTRRVRSGGWGGWGWMLWCREECMELCALRLSEVGALGYQLMLWNPKINNKEDISKFKKRRWIEFKMRLIQFKKK